MPVHSPRQPDDAHLPETPETEPRRPVETEPAADDAAAEAAAREASPSDEVAELKDRLLRALAETENVRQRAEREKADARRFAIAKLAGDLLTVADNFQRALASVDDTARRSGGEALANVLAGIELTERELMAAFEKNGLKRVTPAPGDKFDPHLHQAVAEVPAADQAPGSIVAVTQTGYVLADRLLRPAMVMVAGPPLAEGGGAPAEEA